MASDIGIELIEKIVCNSATKEEIQLFNSWLDESENNRKFYQQVKAIWDRLDSKNDSLKFNEAAAKKIIISRIQQRQIKARVLKARYWISAAASLLILFSIGYLVFSSGNLPGSSLVYRTRSNEVIEIELPDNSRVWLNEHSILKVAGTFDNRQRRVSLKGEAYFEVTRNEEKPFKVFTGRTTTKVLGTSFNLMYDTSHNVQLIVNTGSVEFYKKYSFNKRRIYSAGDKGEYNSSGGQVSRSENKDLNFLSWKTGILTFSNTPLDEVCNTLSKHFKISVESTIKDSDLSLTGTFENEDLEEILSTMAITLDILIDSSGSGIVISRYQNE